MPNSDADFESRRQAIPGWDAFDELMLTAITEITGRALSTSELQRGWGMDSVMADPNAAARIFDFMKGYPGGASGGRESDDPLSPWASRNFMLGAMVPKKPDILARIANVLDKGGIVPPFFELTPPKLETEYDTESTIVMEMPGLNEENSGRLLSVMRKALQVDVHPDDIDIRADREGIEFFILRRMGERDRPKQPALPQLPTGGEVLTDYVMSIVAPERADFFARVANVLAKGSLTADHFEMTRYGVGETMIYAEFPMKHKDSDTPRQILTQRLIGNDPVYIEFRPRMSRRPRYDHLDRVA